MSVESWTATVGRIGPLDPGWATLIAGLLALAAGTLAYRGAVRSVRFEQERVSREVMLRRYNLYLKAEHMAYNLTRVSKLGLLSAQLEFTKFENGEPVPGIYPSDTVAVTRPVQLTDLWSNLSDFPPSAIYEIRAITRAFDEAEAYLGREQTVPDNGRSPLSGYYSQIFDAAAVLTGLMAKYTMQFCAEVKDRGILLYGVPED